jgi:hypothetical protein
MYVRVYNLCTDTLYSMHVKTNTAGLCMYICVCVCVCVFIYMYIYMYTLHAHTQACECTKTHTFLHACTQIRVFTLVKHWKCCRHMTGQMFTSVQFYVHMYMSVCVCIYIYIYIYIYVYTYPYMYTLLRVSNWSDATNTVTCAWFLKIYEIWYTCAYACISPSAERKWCNQTQSSHAVMVKCSIFLHKNSCVCRYMTDIWVGCVHVHTRTCADTYT